MSSRRIANAPIHGSLPGSAGSNGVRSRTNSLELQVSPSSAERSTRRPMPGPITNSSPFTDRRIERQRPPLATSGTNSTRRAGR